MIFHASRWLSILEEWDDSISCRFNEIYGKTHSELISERRNKIIEMLKTFLSVYGDKEVVITRSPGRVNLLGRHIEHRGGSINVMSIDRETLLICAKRNDDTVNLLNTDSNFKSESFSISEMLKSKENDNWLDYIENDEIMHLVMNTKGSWANYVKASVLRLVYEYKNADIKGMDMLFAGNIPIAAGLSSSSSIVVATTEALAELNNFNIEAKDFIHLCGEGEWFVGSRGGAGDHAAMKCSKRNMITHLKFCPFEIGKSVEFPSDYNIVVANSFVEAKKSEGARDKFNQKVACYEFGFLLFKKKFPEFSSKLNYLKDISPENLSVDDSQIYKMLLKIPEFMTADEIYKALPEFSDEINHIMSTHIQPDFYEIRSTLLYGISECLRAERCIELLIEKNFTAIGQLMYISHNGDRITKDARPYDYSANDVYLTSLINARENGDKNNTALYMQPGGYACSTSTIDSLIDYVSGIDGVLGAELSGAGLGGCIIILVKKESTENLLSCLKNNYYDKNLLPMGAEVYIPVSGSSAF